MSDYSGITLKLIAVPAAEEPAPIAAKQEPLLDTTKKPNADEKESKCPRCSLVFLESAMKMHVCSPVRGEIIQFAKDNHLSMHEMRVVFHITWTKYRERYPYSKDDMRCGRCKILVAGGVFVGHVCNPEEGPRINFFDSLLDKYHDKDVINDELENLYKNTK